MGELLKPIAGVLGAAIVAAVAHNSVMSNGGYGTPMALVIICMGAGVVVGSAVIVRCWVNRRIGLALCLVLALVAGETYQVVTTAERTVIMRDARQAPLTEKAEARKKAAQSVREAEARLAGIQTTSRLDRAVAAKSAADSAVLEKASERGCVAHCRALLEQQVLTAKQELDSAHQELTATRAAAAEELEDARTILAGIVLPGSASPLADRFGIEGWVLDLILAGLLSIAVNVLGAALVAFAAHPQKAVAANIVANEIPTNASRRTARGEAAKFAADTFVPDPDGTVSLADMCRAYRGWCKRNGMEPLPIDAIGSQLNDLFEKAGLEVNGSQLRGVGWRPAIAAT